MTSRGYSNERLLIAPAALRKRLGDPALALIDTRPAEAFAAGHIEGAAHFDLFGMSLTDTRPEPLRAYLWMMAHLFAARGVNETRAVVVYDADTGMRAARAFWFLEHFGHPDVRVLHGGTRAWARAGHALTRDARAPEKTDWLGDRVEENLATADLVLSRLGKPDARILDTRSDEEYFGENIRAARGGAIPGAVHLEWTRNLTPEGEFKPADALRAMYEQAGIRPEHEVLTYCQGGYRAAHSYLALRLLGYPRVRTYLGSWKEWGDRLDLPIEHPRRAPSSRA
ncbi:MAG: sulfurtransferase [Deltaproteobacteria bacterium]|nr:sulfurtransferase [Deltaproteobacteria bacterium]